MAGTQRLFYSTSHHCQGGEQGVFLGEGVSSAQCLWQRECLGGQGSVAVVGLGQALWVTILHVNHSLFFVYTFVINIVPLTVFFFFFNLIAVSSPFFLISACDLSLLCLQISSLA